MSATTSGPTSPGSDGPTTATVAPDAKDALHDELLQARRTAIDVSGWGARFRFVQPRNACFWVYVLLVATGAWTLVGMVVPTAGVFGQANAAALVTSSLFAVACSSCTASTAGSGRRAGWRWRRSWAAASPHPGPSRCPGTPQ